MDSPAQELMRLSPARREAVLSTLSVSECAALEHDWDGFWARPEQIVPDGRWRSCLVMAGRGWGKTRVGAEWIRQQVMRRGKRRVALVSQTAKDGRDVMCEGESGLCNIGPPAERPRYEPSKRRLTWRNGAVATIYSDEEPEQLRGPQHDCAWIDELCKFNHPKETIDNLEFGLRLGTRPQAVYTTTPKPIPIIRELLADPLTITIRGTTYDNIANLAPSFIARVIRKYEGTRIGRQELLAELLGDVPGALWRREDIDANRVARADCLARIVVAIDPAVTSGEDSDETGIVGAGIDLEGEGFVLADRSLRASPRDWAEAAIALYRELTADLIIAENNNGGDLVETVIRTVDPDVPIRLVHASRGKRVRAQPIASLYEQKRVHHVGSFPDLEDQMCTWTPHDLDSPDRMDALVWALSALYLEREQTQGYLVREEPGYQISPY